MKGGIDLCFDSVARQCTVSVCTPNQSNPPSSVVPLGRLPSCDRGSFCSILNPLQVITSKQEYDHGETRKRGGTFAGVGEPRDALQPLAIYALCALVQLKKAQNELCSMVRAGPRAPV